MGSAKYTPEEIRHHIEVAESFGGNIGQAATALGIARETLRYHVKTKAPEMGLAPEPFEVEPLPDEIAPTEEIIERRKKEFQRRDEFETSRKLIRVKVTIDGPIGIAHFGDPHVDDPGCNIGLLESHLNIVRDTEGLFGANVGDMQNNWIGRLARLFGEQQTTHREAWALVEWMINSVQWLYILGGNHDLWSGAGDPLQWITRAQQGVYEAWGARMALDFPNGKEVRVNARHDFTGHSMWNPLHGPMKAIQMGWRDHVLSCGHKHVSGHSPLKCPATGLISHAIRVAGYKIHDRYGKELGLPNQNISPAFVTIIDPQYADDDPRLITTLYDVEEGASYLTWKRGRG